MTLPEIAKYRLSNQQIARTNFTKASELVAWLGAVQAQEYALTKWSLGLRLPHLTDPDIEQAFTTGAILRTHLLRPTWHFVTAEDIRWLLRLTAPRVHAANAYMYRKLELDSLLFNRCNDILIQTLQGGNQLTREGLNDVFSQHGIMAEGHRLSYLMMRAELDGIICSGARQGNQFTYALLDERVPPAKPLTPDEALAELTTRYFTSRGPATLNDFSTWSGLTLTDCKRGLALVKERFMQERIDTETVYFAPPISLRKQPAPGLHLLPMYDEFIMGYRDRKAMMVFRNSLDPSPPFQFDNTILADGQLIGTWKRTISTKSISLVAKFFKPLSDEQQYQFETAIHRFERFTELPVTY